MDASYPDCRQRSTVFALFILAFFIVDNAGGTPDANKKVSIAWRLKDALRKIVEGLPPDLPLVPAGKRGEFNIQTV